MGWGPAWCRAPAPRDKGGIMTNEAAVKHIRQMEAMGLLQKTGEFRDGMPVYVLSRFHDRLSEEAPEQLELIPTLADDISTN